MDMFKALLSCFPSLAVSSPGLSTSSRYYGNKQPSEKDEQLATDIFTILVTADKNDRTLRARVNNMVGATSWSETLAKCMLDKLEAAIKNSAAMGEAMKKCFDKASREAEQFIREHPVFAAAVATIVAIGILVLILPWVVEALGFGELGPSGGQYPLTL